jgi:hypothetical protein
MHFISNEDLSPNKTAITHWLIKPRSSKMEWNVETGCGNAPSLEAAYCDHFEIGQNENDNNKQ